MKHCNDFLKTSWKEQSNHQGFGGGHLRIDGLTD